MKSWSPAKRWTMYVAIAILFAIVCAFLSHWQFSRDEQRRAQNALIENNYDAEPVPIAEAIPEGGSLAPGDEWRPVVLTGEYLSDDELLARNRPQGGAAAYEVITPLLLDDGRVVAVDRGWVESDYAGGAEAVPPAPEGEVEVIARLRPSEPLPDRGADEGQIPSIHVPLVADETGRDTIESTYVIMVSEDPAPAARPAPLAEPDIDPGPHLSYAIQWILFAVMGFGFIGYMIRTEIVARNEGDDPDEDDDDLDVAAPRRPKRRRRDRDAEEEDALLDA